MGHRDESRLRSEGPRHVIGIDEVVAICRQSSKRNGSVLLHLVQRAGDGVVLQHRSNGMVALPQHTLDCHVEGIGRVQGEDDPLRTRTAKKTREQTPRRVDHRFRFNGAPVAAASRIGGRGTHEGVHAAKDRLGFRKRCCRVVEIDHVILFRGNQAPT